jgi:hypothetical protein
MSVPPLAPSTLSGTSGASGRTVVSPPRAMEGIVPIREAAAARPLSPEELAARRR